MILATLLISFALLLALSVPVAWALGISSGIAVILMGLPLEVIPQKILTGMDLFPMLCIPLFIMAGEIMGKGGITRRLLLFAVMVVGFVRGGLAIANVLASMLFGGITGSGVADASALGSIEIPMMKENGYDLDFSAAITAASACIGPIIPPSILVVIYSLAVPGVSIGGMFAGGMIPGIIIGLALMIACYVISVKKKYPKREVKLTRSEILHTTWDASLALLSPIIILGGIIGGVFTATEAAAVSVVYSLILAFFVYKEISVKDLPGIFYNTAITTAVVMIIIGTSNVFGMVIAFEQLAVQLEALVRPLGYFGFLIAINVILLIIGTFLDPNPAILILAPVFAPIAAKLGIHPIQFGCIFVINLVIGMITPPLGACLFVVSPIAKVSVEKVTVAVIPFLVVEIIVLLLVSYIPQLTLIAPKLAGFM
jgi:C4-dicarboxylate transporter DctM subunit